MKGGEIVTDFEKLFRDYQDFIYKYLLRLTKSYTLAEEFTQETFFRAYMNRASLRNKEKVAVWLCQIAKNIYFSWYNEHKKIQPLDETVCIEKVDKRKTSIHAKTERHDKANNYIFLVFITF